MNTYKILAESKEKHKLEITLDAEDGNYLEVYEQFLLDEGYDEYQYKILTVEIV